MIRRIVIVVVCASLLGCASKSKDVSAAYVSPLMYQNLTCEQIAQEAQTVSSRAAQAMGQQDQKATNDAVALTVGLVVFWPALFLMSGSSAPTAEVARLKGEMQALEQASIQKNCRITFAPVEPTRLKLPPKKAVDSR